MQVYENIDEQGKTIIVLEKKDGQDLLRALEFATAPAHALREMKSLSKTSRAHKIAKQLEEKLYVF